MVYVPQLLVLTLSYSCDLWVQNKCSGKTDRFLTAEIMCAVNILERSYLLLLHPYGKLTLRMTSFLSNPSSNILVMRLANVVVVLMQSLHILSHCGKYSENCYLFSPTVQSKQNFAGMSTAVLSQLLNPIL